MNALWLELCACDGEAAREKTVRGVSNFLRDVVEVYHPAVLRMTDLDAEQATPQADPIRTSVIAWRVEQGRLSTEASAVTDATERRARAVESRLETSQ